MDYNIKLATDRVILSIKVIGKNGFGVIDILRDEIQELHNIVLCFYQQENERSLEICEVEEGKCMVKLRSN